MALTVAQLVARVTADTSGFYKSMAIMNSSLIRTGSFASRALAGIGLATVGVGILSLRAAGNFQQAMNILQAVSGATMKDMSALRGEALALGKDFKLPNVSAKDAADAMVELSKAGLSTKQILGATRGALQLGLAANIGYADSARLTARTLKAFDLEGNQAVRIANLLAAGANKSTAEITDLALGVQNAGAQFHGANLPVEDLVASLSIMADNALSGEYAGTALKTMLIRLQSPTDKAAAVMDKYGISIFDAHGNMKSMPNIIAQFQKSLGSLTQEQREQALTTIFGVRANQAMRILMNEGADAYKNYRSEITGTNAAVKISEARTKGLNGAFGALGSAVETLAIQLGTYFLPAAEKVVRGLADMVAAIDPDAIARFLSPIGDAVSWFKNLADHSVVLRAALIGLAAAFGGFLVISMVTALVSGLVGAFAALGAVLLANPIVLVAAALIGLGAALVYAYKHSETFRNAVDAAFSFVKSLLPGLQAFGQSVIRVFQDIYNLVRPIVTQTAETVRQVFQTMVNFVQDNMGRIRAVVQAVWNIIRAYVQTVVNNILSIIRIFAAALHGDWAEVWNQLKAIVSRTISTIVTILRNGVSLLYNAAILLGKAIWEGIKLTLDLIGQKVQASLSKITEAISAVVGIAYNAAIAIGRGIIQGILSGLGGLVGAVKDKVTGAIHSAIGGIKGALGIGSPSKVTRDEIGIPLAEGITVGMLLGLQELPAKMSAKVKEAVDAAKQTVQDQATALSSAFDRLIGDALRVFDAQTENFKTRAEKMLDVFNLQQVIAENKKRIAELVADVEKARTTLLAFENAPRPTVTQNEGESDAAFNQRRLEAEQAWAAQYNQLQTDYLNASIALQDEKDSQKLAKKKAKLEEEAAESRKQYNAQRELQRRSLEDQLADLTASLQKHPERWRFYQTKVLNLLGSYTREFRGAGQMLGDSFAAGLEQSIENIERAGNKLAATIARYLYLHSPAEKGPLSTLDKWWAPFGKTLLSGLSTSDVSRAAASLAGTMGVLSPGSYGLQSAGALGATASGGAPIYNFYVKVEGSLIRQQDLADELYQLVSQQGNRGKSLL